MHRAALAILWLVVLVAGVAIATQVRWPGGLGSYGNRVGLPVRVDAPFSIGMGAIDAKRPIRIEAVRLHDASGGVVLHGALVSTEHGMVVRRGFPPWSHGAHSAEGAVVPAHVPVTLLVGLRATRPGDFFVDGVDILYRERWFGVDVRRRAHFGLQAVGCAVRTTESLPQCTVPETADS
jgi:hypothetical protein